MDKKQNAVDEVVNGAYFRVSAELLVDAFAMPEGTELFWIETNWKRPGEFLFFVRHEALPEIEQGERYPQIVPVITQIDGREPREWVEFDWNIGGFDLEDIDRPDLLVQELDEAEREAHDLRIENRSLRAELVKYKRRIAKIEKMLLNLSVAALKVGEDEEE